MMILFQEVHGNNEPGESKRTRNVDPRPSSFLMELATGSEEESDALQRWASRGLNRLNALIRKGVKSPEGERKQVGHSGASDRSGFGEGSMGDRRSRPGTVTSEWEPGNGFSLRASERPLQDNGPNRK